MLVFKYSLTRYETGSIVILEASRYNFIWYDIEDDEAVISEGNG